MRCDIKNCQVKIPHETFYGLPLGKIGAKWINVIGKHQEFVEKSTFMVCARHFMPDQFVASSVGTRKILKSDAVPRLFPVSKNKNILPKVCGKQNDPPKKQTDAPQQPKIVVLKKMINTVAIHQEPPMPKRLKLSHTTTQTVTTGSLRPENVKLIDISTIMQNSPKPVPKSPPEPYAVQKPNVKQSCVNCSLNRQKLQNVYDEIESLENELDELIAENKRLSKPKESTIKKPIEVPANPGQKRCEYCRRVQSSDDMKHHSCLGHDLVCNLCSLSFESTKHLVAHLTEVDHSGMMKNKDPIFKCDKCPLVYRMEILLKCHRESHKNHLGIIPKVGRKPTKVKISFNCYICKEEFPNISSLRRHMIRHEKAHSCAICKENLTLVELLTHLCRTNGSDLCEYCNASFQSTVELSKHLESHDEKIYYECKTCGKFLPARVLLESHKMQHTANEEKNFICTICGKCFAERSTLLTHEKNHDTTKKFHCDECNASFKIARNLEMHKRSKAHSEPTIACPDCPMKFCDKFKLKRHSSVHSDQKFICEICNKALSSLCKLQKHSRIHNRTEADRKYACEICPMKFFTLKNLRKHQAVHKEGRDFKCRFCDVAYKYKGDLNKHLKIHMGDKIHECPKCPMRFQYPAELQKHSYDHYKQDKEKGIVE